MKKFVKDTLGVCSKIYRYQESLYKKYNLNRRLIEQAEVVILGGFVCKDRFNSLEGLQSISSVNKVIIGGATPFGDKRLYISFDSCE